MTDTALATAAMKLSSEELSALKAVQLRADVLDAMHEVTEVLALYSSRLGREIELILRTDGSATVMGGDEAATSFEEIAAFESLTEMWDWLRVTAQEAQA